MEETKKAEPEPPVEVKVEPAPIIVEEPVPQKQRYFSDAPLPTLRNVDDKRFIYRA